MELPLKLENIRSDTERRIALVKEALAVLEERQVQNERDIVEFLAPYQTFERAPSQVMFPVEESLKSSWQWAKSCQIQTMNPILIEVTEQDIKEGVRLNGLFCPVQKAIERQFPKALSVYASYFSAASGAFARVTDEHFNKMEFLMDGQVSDFMNTFDAGQPVEPFSFNLYSK